jgi:hypothetical protein
LEGRGKFKSKSLTESQNEGSWRAILTLGSRKAVETQENDINMVTVRKMNYQQPVKSDLVATP